jgi:hypothetical protein
VTNQEFQDAAREAAQETHMLAAARLAEYVAREETDIEITLKVYNATKDVAQAVPEKKQDPYAGLAVFNVTFVNGSMKATLERVDEVVNVEDVFLLAPSPAMLAATNLNEDLAGLSD